jgi:hypothetical protein
MLSSLKLTLGTIATISLLTVMGCDKYPLEIQNKTKAPIRIEYSTKGGKCDLAKSETLELDPDEVFAIQCGPTDLLSVRFRGPSGQSCALSSADIARLVKAEKGFEGSYRLPLQDC